MTNGFIDKARITVRAGNGDIVSMYDLEFEYQR